MQLRAENVPAGALKNAGAVTQFQFLGGQRANSARFVQKCHGSEHIPHLAAVGTGVHVHRAAHAAGDAEGKLKPRKALGGRGLAQSVQPKAGIGINGRPLKAGRASHGRGVQHGAVKSGIGKQDVGTFAKEIIPHAVLTAQPDNFGHLFAVFGGAEHPGRAADAKAGVL